MSETLTPPRSTAIPPTPAVVTPPPVSTPPQQPPPQPFRWTLKDYRELADTGLLNEKRCMLLDGVLYVMPNPNPPHDIALGQIDDWLRSVFAPPGFHVRNQMSFDVGEDTDPGPDLAVVAGVRKDYSAGAPRAAALLVEVADSSLSTDITTKAEKYATAGVPDYWVLDLMNRVLVVFREPEPLPAGLGATAYRQRNTFGPDAVVSPLAAPTASVRVADLLP